MSPSFSEENTEDLLFNNKNVENEFCNAKNYSVKIASEKIEDIFSDDFKELTLVENEISSNFDMSISSIDSEEDMHTVYSVSNLLKSIDCIRSAYLNYIGRYNTFSMNINVAVGIILHEMIEKDILFCYSKFKYLNIDERLLKNEIESHQIKTKENLKNLLKLDEIFAWDYERKFTYKNLKGVIDIVINNNIIVELKTGREAVADILQSNIYFLSGQYEKVFIVYTKTGYFKEVKNDEEIIFRFLNRFNVLLDESPEESTIIKSESFFENNLELFSTENREKFTVKFYEHIECTCSYFSTCNDFIKNNLFSNLYRYIAYCVNNIRHYKVSDYCEGSKIYCGINSSYVDVYYKYRYIGSAYRVDDHFILYDQIPYKFLSEYLTVTNSKKTYMDMFGGLAYIFKDSILKHLLENHFCQDQYSLIDVDSIDLFSEDEHKRIKKGFALNLPKKFYSEFGDLNKEQRRVVEYILFDKQILNIDGCPGGGKTHIINLLIKIFDHYNFNILVVGNTKKSMYNILMRLKSYRTNILFEFEGVGSNDKTDNNILFSTFSNLNSKYLLNRKFDLIIIDEVTQAHFLIAANIFQLRKNRLVTFGDSNQISPILHDSIYNISLNEILNDTLFLNKSYRNCEHMVQLYNQYYKNRVYTDRCNRKDCVVFTTDISILENEKIKKLVYFNRLKENLVNSETIDRFQGSEEDEIILCLNVDECEITLNINRLIVGLSRAKKKLIILIDEEVQNTLVKNLIKQFSNYFNISFN